MSWIMVRMQEFQRNFLHCGIGQSEIWW